MKINKINSILAVFGALFLVSCASVNTPVNNIIKIDKHGEPTLPGTKKNFPVQDPADENQQITYEDHIEKVLDFKGKKKILIYLHGGLVRYKKSEKRAAMFAKLIEEDGYHPIFVHWNSDLFSSYGEHLFFQRQGEHWTVFGPLTSPIVLVMDLGSAIFRTPMIWVYQSASYFKGLGLKTSRNVRTAIHNSKILDDTPEIEHRMGEDKRGRGVKVTQGTLGLVQLGISFFTAPLLDAVGTGSWDVMRRRTDLVFTKNHTEKHETIEEFREQRKGALTLFFDRLKEKVAGGDYEIILAGHSMGTFIASEILHLWPEIKYDRIVFMAAACSIKDFEFSVTPYLRNNPSTRFYNYALHPKAENYESYVFGLGGVGSLLVHIDNLYANPVSKKERTLGKWENIMNSLNSFHPEVVKNRQIYLRTMPYDLKMKEQTYIETHAGYPIKHGQFATAYGYWKDDLSRQVIWGKEINFEKDSDQ